MSGASLFHLPVLSVCVKPINDIHKLDKYCRYIFFTLLLTIDPRICSLNNSRFQIQKSTVDSVIPKSSCHIYGHRWVLFLLPVNAAHINSSNQFIYQSSTNSPLLTIAHYQKAFVRLGYWASLQLTAFENQSPKFAGTPSATILL